MAVPGCAKRRTRWGATGAAWPAATGADASVVCRSALNSAEKRPAGRLHSHLLLSRRCCPLPPTLLSRRPPSAALGPAQPACGHGSIRVEQSAGKAATLAIAIKQAPFVDEELRAHRVTDTMLRQIHTPASRLSTQNSKRHSVPGTGRAV